MVAPMPLARGGALLNTAQILTTAQEGNHMQALKDLLAAAEAAEAAQEGPENSHVIDNGYTRRDYISNETETIRERADGGAAPETDTGGRNHYQEPEPLEGEVIEADPGPYQDHPRGAEIRHAALGDFVGNFPDADTGEAVADAPEEPELVEVTCPGGRTVAIEPEPAQEPEAQDGEQVGYCIEERHHSKRRFTFYQVTLSARVDRETFNTLRAACILANGWYNKAWAGEAGGFAFRAELDARAFANEHLGAPRGPQGPGPGSKAPEPDSHQETPREPQAAPPNHGNKLRALADTMQSKIDDKLGERMENTPKRLAQAARARLEGYQLQRAQVVMRRLADMWDAGAVPPLLLDVHTRAAIVDAMACALEDQPNGFYSYKVEAQPLRPRHETPTTAMLWEIYRQEPEAMADPAETQLRELLPRLRARKYAGYFFTPPEVAARVHEAAAVEPWSRVLEPSAGDGALLEGLPVDTEAGGMVMACEIQPDLCEALRLRGFDARPVDFLELPLPTAPLFDRVIMNPPFEKLQDLDHVRRAWEHLAPSGRLVAIMSRAWTFHDTHKAREFREWVEELGGEWEELPPGSFTPAGTSVNTGMLTLRK